MSLVALASLKGSPGVSTTSLLLASTWPADSAVVVIEADADGGVAAPRYGISTDPGLVSLSAATRRTQDLTELDRHVQSVPGGLKLVPGPASAEQARSALSTAVGLGDVLREAHVDVLLDCGRLGPASAARSIAGNADLLLWVTRPRLDELHHLAARPALEGGSGALERLLLIGEAPYGHREVERALDLPVLGVLPDDPQAAWAIRTGRAASRATHRSSLVRVAQELAADIRGSVGTAAPASAGVDA